MTTFDLYAAYYDLLYGDKDYAAEALARPREPVADHLDEYEHFGNRRLRTVGELIQDAFRVGLYRMERVVRERLSAAPTRATRNHDPPFDPCSLPKALQVIARAKDVSHPDT